MHIPSFQKTTILIAEIIFIGIIGGILALTYFLYVSYYQSIALTQRISLLRQEVAITEIDTKSVARLQEFFARREGLTPIDPKKIRDPFAGTQKTR